MKQTRIDCKAFFLTPFAQISILGMLTMMAQPVAAQTLSSEDQRSSQVVHQERIEKTIPGTYHYESTYSLRKDEKGNYTSTYQSQQTEWFCCLNVFSSTPKNNSENSK